MNKVIIFADGASLGNPGPAAIGAILKDERGKILALMSRRIGRETNNHAEYSALIAALEEADRLGASEAEIKLDSELVVKQITGRYRVKSPALKPLYNQAKTLLGQLKYFTITHVPREQNVEADKLANKALKQA